MRIESPLRFAELIEKFSYIGNNSASLTNISFFMGAGFSKSWNPIFPMGNELFTIPAKELHLLSNLNYFLETQGYDPLREITPMILKDIIYRLNMQLKYPEIRTRYIDENTIKLIINEIKWLVQQNFEKILPLNYIDSDIYKFPLPNTINEDQKQILLLFDNLQGQQDGSYGFPRGVRFNFITTNYDYLIETILDNIISEDDTLFLYSYRGITPSKISGKENISIVHQHILADNLFKINGGFEIIYNNQNYELEYRKRSEEQIKNNPPIIMLPSREQDYLDHYFLSVFPKAVRLLQESKILVIVGYSLPEEDILLRFLLKQFAEDIEDIINKFIFYIDLASDTEQMDKLIEVFKYTRLFRINMFPYSGGFAQWATGVNYHLRELGLAE